MTDLIQKAEYFARLHHAGQTYDNGKDYATYHLQRVKETLERFGVIDEEILAAGLLHDVVEDTDVTHDDIYAKFGARVEHMVYCVTDKEGVNRLERHINTYPDIADSPDATCVKLADRITNVETSLKWEDEYIKMYREEHSLFTKLIYREGVHEEMWEHLNGLIEGGTT